MEYKFSGEITFDDYLHFNKFIMKKYLIIRISVLIFLMILACLFLWDNNAEKEFSFHNQNAIAIFIFLIIIYFLIKLFFSKKRYRKLYDSNKTIGEKCYYIIDENSIKTNSESNNSTLTKENVYKIVIDNNYFYIFIAANMVKIVKNSFCNNNEEYDSLVMFLKENYNDKIKSK